METHRTTRNRTARIGLGLAVAAMLLLGACSSDSEDAAGADLTQGTTTGDTSFDGDSGAEAPAFGADGADGDGLLTSFGQTTDAGRAIVRHVGIGIEVEDPTAAVDAITAAAQRAGGFVAEADLHRVDSSDRRDLLQGTMTLRIPVDRLDATLATLTELSVSAPETTISTEDVTGQLVDLEARLTNLRALEVELRSFLSEAREAAGATPDTVLAVFERINQVRSEIEQLEAQRSNLSDLVALATLRVDLRPATGAGALVPDGWSPTGVLRSATRATLATLQGLANVAIWLGAFAIPVGLALGLPSGAVWWAVRRRRAAESPA